MWETIETIFISTALLYAAYDFYMLINLKTSGTIVDALITCREVEKIDGYDRHFYFEYEFEDLHGNVIKSPSNPHGAIDSSYASVKDGDKISIAYCESKPKFNFPVATLNDVIKSRVIVYGIFFSIVGIIYYI